jgi:TRAP-type C4-dicarboxylate transport system permease large subunit
MTHVLFDIPLSKLYRGVRPFIAIYLLALALITSVPEITLVPCGFGNDAELTRLH